MSETKEKPKHDKLYELIKKKYNTKSPVIMQKPKKQKQVMNWSL